MNLQKAAQLKQKIRNGQTTIGSWMQISHPTIAEILSQSGYEWIAVDLEHGAFSPGDLPNLFRAIELHGALPFVRLATGSRQEIKTSLDAGAKGLIVPMAESAAQIRSIIREMQYPPQGIRGVGFSRANMFGKHFDNYYEHINSSLSIVAQIEHIDAIRNLDEILQVSEVDVLMIGPYDLSASMQIAGRFDELQFQSALATFKEKCQKAQKTMGIHVVKPDPGQLNVKIKDGYRFLAYSVDGTFLQEIANLSPIRGEM